MVHDTVISNHSSVVEGASMNIYYVYYYLRSKDSDIAPAGTPYYVGKGCNNRAWQTRKNKPKDYNCIVIIAANLTENEAFELEISEISRLGRVDLGTGILRNRTNGGEGSSGIKVSNTTLQKRKEKIESWTTDFRKEVIEKRRKSNTGQKRTLETKTKMRKSQMGKKHTAETRCKLSKIKKDFKHTEETKLKMSESHKGKVFTEAHRQNLSKSRLGKIGRPRSIDTKNKISKARRGEKQSAETIAKRVATRKANKEAGLVSKQTMYKKSLESRNAVGNS